MRLVAADLQGRPLPPGDLIGYLRATTWERDPSDRAMPTARMALFVHRAANDEVSVPLDVTARDYRVLLAEAINLVARVEGRQPHQVLSDLRVALADVVRVANLEEFGGGVSLADGAALLTSSKDLVTAAAMASQGPRATYPGRRRTIVRDLLREVLFGQTEPGSFVVRVLVPLPSQVGGNAMSAGPSSTGSASRPIPPARQMTEMLIQAVAKAAEAGRLSVATDNLDAFREAVPFGVSAELCKALASAGGESRAGISIGVSWARARPGPHANPVQLGATMLEVLGQASRFLSDTSTRTDFELVGLVEAMSADAQNRTHGDVTILGLVDGKLRRVRTTLDELDYQVAIDAHKREQPVVVVGELAGAGHRYRLDNPSDIRVLPEDDSELDRSESGAS